ncbi:MAG: FAD:protein FMN transferase [bacterium]
MKLSPHLRSFGISGAAMRVLRDVAGATLPRASRASRARRFVFHYEHVLGTSLELQVVASHERAARCAEGAVLAEVDRLAAILSGYSESSELIRWTRTFGTDVSVSPELAEVLEAAEQWRFKTTGSFSAAAVSLVELLRDGPSEETSDASRAHLVRERVHALRQPQWSVDRARGIARRRSELSFSLDALAKGYIVDRAAACARDVDGVSHVLLNIGGDLRHHGTRALRVGVASPFAPAENARPLAMVHLRDAALATSGGYRRGFMMNGRHVSHILDPRTGLPASRIVSASVFAPDCATADALSTAFSVMEPRESVTLAYGIPNVGCLIVERNGTVTTNAVWNAAALSQNEDTTYSR